MDPDFGGHPIDFRLELHVACQAVIIYIPIADDVKKQACRRDGCCIRPNSGALAVWMSVRANAGDHIYCKSIVYSIVV